MTVVQLFNRERRAQVDFEKVNRDHMIAFKDTIFAYALYYPTVDFLSMLAIAIVICAEGSAFSPAPHGWHPRHVHSILHAFWRPFKI